MLFLPKGKSWNKQKIPVEKISGDFLFFIIFLSIFGNDKTTKQQQL